jgi:HAD superfamily hydrolase (TIGR01549 family)
MGAPMLIEELVGKADEELEEGHSRWYGQFFRQLRPFEGARELVRRCADAGLVVVFASSASESESKALMSALEVDDVVHAVTTSADVEDAKPEPDVIRVALERGGLSPESALLVGDTVWDMKAAARAGVSAVAVLTGGIGRAELQEAGAIEVYDSVQALLDDFAASPLGALAG